LVNVILVLANGDGKTKIIRVEGAYLLGRNDGSPNVVLQKTVPVR